MAFQNSSLKIATLEGITRIRFFTSQLQFQLRPILAQLSDTSSRLCLPAGGQSWPADRCICLDFLADVTGWLGWHGTLAHKEAHIIVKYCRGNILDWKGDFSCLSALATSYIGPLCICCLLCGVSKASWLMCFISVVIMMGKCVHNGHYALWLHFHWVRSEVGHSPKDCNDRWDLEEELCFGRLCNWMRKAAWFWSQLATCQPSSAIPNLLLPQFPP